MVLQDSLGVVDWAELPLYRIESRPRSQCRDLNVFSLPGTSVFHVIG